MRSQQDCLSHSQAPKEALAPPQAGPTDSSKNSCLERRDTWLVGRWRWALQKADPKMSRRFCLGLPWLLVLPRLSLPKPSEVLLWCQKLPSSLPIHSLCLGLLLLLMIQNIISAQELVADNMSFSWNVFAVASLVWVAACGLSLALTAMGGH